MIMYSTRTISLKLGLFCIALLLMLTACGSTASQAAPQPTVTVNHRFRQYRPFRLIVVGRGHQTMRRALPRLLPFMQGLQGLPRTLQEYLAQLQLLLFISRAVTSHSIKILL